MSKNCVLYGARPLPGGKWGIHVLTVRGGYVETENLNTMPWPTRAIALEQAKRSAACEAEREGVPVAGEIVGDVRPGMACGSYYRGAA